VRGTSAPNCLTIRVHHEAVNALRALPGGSFRPIRPLRLAAVALLLTGASLAMARPAWAQAPQPAPEAAAPAAAPEAPPPVAAPPKVKQAAKPPAPPPEVKISQDPRPSFHPDSAGMITQASRAYADLAQRGGWTSVPEGPALKPGQEGSAVPFARVRLAAEGEQLADLVSPRIDAELAAAIRRFQQRYGLPESGILGPATVKAMNVPAADRARALAYSAERLASSSFAFGQRYVAVNIPSAAVEAVEFNAVARRYVAVVGDREHPSPVVEARIGAINLNPTWTVPVSIVRNEIIPKMRKDPGYLAKSRIRMFGASGQEIDPARIDWSKETAVNYTLRQDSGTANALGQIRIAMPNRHSVYMHDTPSKRFFGRDFRFLSHGCVRVSGVVDLAAWLMEPQGLPKAAIEAGIAAGERRDIGLSKPVPVAWVYLTGFVTADGSVHFRDDVYGLDRPDPLDELVTATIAQPMQ
jgi:L,D-transpeptidase YcbB